MLLAPSTNSVPLQLTELTSTKGQQPLLTSANCSLHKEKDHLSAKTQDIMEAMSKLDAKLVAYLAGDDVSPKEPSIIYSSVQNDPPFRSLLNDISKESCHQVAFQHQGELLKAISGVKLQMEALTLQAEGTKRMELLQNDIRPIFTVDCQLSHDIIKGVPRHDMFHIMQFESEKFHSLTQCTRFGQEAQREIRFIVNERQNEEYNFGHIFFTVWWREPGTCLNEMLGMGELQLNELFYASLLEKCKCITINRCGAHLASLYFKISLLLQPLVPPRLKDVHLHEAFDTTIMQCGNNNANDDEEKVECKAIDTQKQSKFQGESGKASMPVGGSSATDQSCDDKLLELGSSEFTIETAKVRLLKGFLYANETRNFGMLTNCDYFLVCRRFWLETAIAVTAGNGKKFNYQEQFAVINDDKFLNSVNMQHLQLEIWKRNVINVDGNGNSDSRNVEALGIIHLPLHQFFIAYRDTSITNHLCKAKMPVISIDAWVPISCWQTREILGEIKCLLAIGSDEQIINLRRSRSFEIATTLTTDHGLILEKPLTFNEQNKFKKSTFPQNISKAVLTTFNPQLKRTSDLLGMLQNVLTESPGAGRPRTTLGVDRHLQVDQEELDTITHVDAVIDQFEDTLDLGHINLAQSIKRKFIELEHISQRLRTRLADVTGEQLAANFDISILDNWQPLTVATALDDQLDEFEQDINEAIHSPSTSAAKPFIDAVFTPAEDSEGGGCRKKC